MQQICHFELLETREGRRTTLAALERVSVWSPTPPDGGFDEKVPLIFILNVIHRPLLGQPFSPPHCVRPYSSALPADIPEEWTP